MIKKVLPALSLILCVNAYADSADPVKILSFNIDPLEIVDATGAYIRDISQSELPSPEILVEHFNRDEELVQIKTLDGTLIWLDTYYVNLSETKDVDIPCTVLAQAKDSKSVEAGTMGFGNNCPGSEEQ